MYFSDPVKVTKGKSALEKALKLAKKLKKETTMVKDFLESVNQDLDSKEATPGVHNLDQDLSYVKVLQGYNIHIYMAGKCFYPSRGWIMMRYPSIYMYMCTNLISTCLGVLYSKTHL